ncbi:MAG: prolyl oligopeptidase family serine peptidase [Pseudomonadota bacterium]
MTDKLTLHRRPSASGKTGAIVVFVHGYGADGKDLLGLAEPLSAHLPDVAFVAPDAPDPCTNNPMGFQWAPIPWLDGSSEVAAAAAFARSSDLLGGLLDDLLTESGLGPDRLLLFGFSQGTMLSLHVAPRRTGEIAGVTGFSGRLLVPERLEAEAVSKPPVLLVHGDADEVVPFSSMGAAAEALQALGFAVYGHVMRGTGHGIAPDGLSVALAFIKERFGIQQSE